MIRELLTWHAVTEQMPDSGRTVLVHAATDGGLPVWLGWYESDGERWLAVDAAELSGVTHWAEMPACRESG